MGRELTRQKKNARLGVLGQSEDENRKKGELKEKAIERTNRA